MDRDSLKTLQAPLKKKYQERPDTALVTLRAHGRLGEGITCRVETGRAIEEAGLHPATGGDGLSLCSGDMLLEALVACAGVTLNAVATSLGMKLRDAILTAEGDIDFRGTLAVSKETPVGFKQIRLHIALDTDATEEERETLIRLTERYCVVYQTLRSSPPIIITQKSRSGSEANDKPDNAAHYWKPAGYPNLSPYLVVSGARRLIDFMRQAFDAVELRRFDSPSGSVIHAEFRIADSVVMLADAGEGYPATPSSLHLYVDDVDSVYRQALGAGGTQVQEPVQKEDDPDRRCAVKDPSGNTWWISTQVG